VHVPYVLAVGVVDAETGILDLLFIAALARI
jgi:hypothetical protein